MTIPEASQIVLERGKDIALAFEVNRLIPDDVVHAAVGENRLSSIVHLKPLDAVDPSAPAEQAHWDFCVAAIESFVDRLIAREAVVGQTPTLHVFGYAPLPLMLVLGYRLMRHPVKIYQSSQTGTWNCVYDREKSQPGEAFFAIDGKLKDRNPGRGDVHLTVGVTHDVRETALRDFVRLGDAEPLAAISLTPKHGTGHTAVRGEQDIAAAACEFRDVLDKIHSCYPGAEKILIAIASSASLAAALGGAINPKAQHVIALYNFRPSEGGYKYAGTIQAQSLPKTAVVTANDMVAAGGVLKEVSAVHKKLVEWLSKPANEHHAKQVGGANFLESNIEPVPMQAGLFSFPYLSAEWKLSVSFALALKDLKARIGDEAWNEGVRLFLLHEGNHLLQQVSTYNFEGIGRAGFVLEAVDYDADVEAVKICHEWRRANRPDDFAADGEIGSLSKSLRSVLHMMSAFRDGGALKSMPERYLRRYLIWLYQWSRAESFPRKAELKKFDLDDRVTIELVGLRTAPDPAANYLRPLVKFGEFARDIEPELVIYHHGLLIREKDLGWLTSLEKAVRTIDEDAVKTLFQVIFDKNRILVGR